MRYSIFNVYVKDELSESVLIKNMLSGAIVSIPSALFDTIPTDAENIDEQLSAHLFDPNDLADNGILVSPDLDEACSWREQLLITRNDTAHCFVLHFLPTIQCQLRCSYCFENGADRGLPIKLETVSAMLEWVERYLSRFPEIDEFRMVLFGGEPLLCSDIGLTAIARVQKICDTRQINFWTEIVTNGELLTEVIAQKLSQYNWRRAQITLDGPEAVHNSRRTGAKRRPTFARITENIRMLLTTNYIPKVDVRLSFDVANCDEVIAFLDELSMFPNISRINLSIGLIMNTFVYHGSRNDHLMAQKVLEFWTKAKSLGFAIPEDYVAGPLCVAIAKHAVVVQPDGNLQKCFAGAGRSQYNFGNVLSMPDTYIQDERYEQWTRTDDCIVEKCAFLPVCGGGCPQDAMIAANSDQGGKNRFCQKSLISSINIGLIKINYGL